MPNAYNHSAHLVHFSGEETGAETRSICFVFPLGMTLDRVSCAPRRPCRLESDNKL